MSLDTEELKILRSTNEVLYNELLSLETIVRDLITTKNAADVAGNILSGNNMQIIINYIDKFGEFVSSYENLRDIQGIIDTYQTRNIFE